jgi:hypothetical protein
MTTMIDRSDVKGKTIIIADRGYESYNILAHAEKKNWNYLIVNVNEKVYHLLMN